MSINNCCQHGEVQIRTYWLWVKQPEVVLLFGTVIQSSQTKSVVQVFLFKEKSSQSNRLVVVMVSFRSLYSSYFQDNLVNNKQFKILILIAILVSIIGFYSFWSNNSNIKENANNQPQKQNSIEIHEQADSIKSEDVHKKTIQLQNKKITQPQNKKTGMNDTSENEQITSLGGEVVNYGGEIPEQYSEYEYDFISIDKDALFSLTTNSFFTIQIPKESTRIELKIDVINKTDMGTSIVASGVDTSNPNGAVITYDSNKTIFGDITTENGKYVLVANGDFAALIDAKTFYHRPTNPLDDTMSSKNDTQGKE